MGKGQARGKRAVSPRVFGVTSSVGISLQLPLLGEALARVFIFLPDAMMPCKEHLHLDSHLTVKLWLWSNTGICVYIYFHCGVFNWFNYDLETAWEIFCSLRQKDKTVSFPFMRNPTEF